jgi:hypothetical protein
MSEYLLSMRVPESAVAEVARFPLLAGISLLPR